MSGTKDETQNKSTHYLFHTTLGINWRTKNS